MRFFIARGLFALFIVVSAQPAYGDATASYRDCVMQIWQPPALVLGRSDFTVELHVFRSKKGAVRKAEVVDTERLKDDPLFRAFVESAMRAALNIRCGRVLPKPAPRGIVLILDPSKLSR